MNTLYSIGYATKPVADFIAQLKHHAIDVVADVRSVPYSKVFHDYHQPAIAQRLRQEAMRYVYLGEELGPRSKDSAHYNAAGQVQFDRLAHAPLFLQGVERLKTGLQKGYRIALMCAEKDAASCHRSLLIGYHLERRFNIRVLHIEHGGTLESQPQLERRLTELHNVSVDLFMSAGEQLEQAYQRQVEQTAYRKPAGS